ncbi:MAG TPA: hypothetical protein VH877_13240 [Polyangia bacterium]|nr:hypothetical protein [Polyangia bacterium]
MTNRAPIPLLLALLSLLAACASVRPKPSEPPVLRIELQHAAPDRFVARIHTDAVRELRFERPTAGRGGWRVRGPGGPLPLLRDGAQDVLRAPSPQGRLGRLDIELPIDERPPEKDYRSFLRFSQGGVLVYTGQLAAAVDGASLRRRVTLTPLPGERIVGRGQVHDGPWVLDDPEDGTYVCFCTVEPIADEHVLAVVDAGMWPETAQTARSLLPPLFAFYERRLGAKLPWRPTIFISGRTEGRGRSLDMGGGTLDGLIQLHLGLGPALSPSDPTVAHGFEGLIAHEAAHLWAGQVFHHDVPKGDWMHEGAADVLAWRALVELGAWPREVLAGRAARAASICLQGGSSGALTEARVKVWYACGATLMLAAEASARARDPRADVLSLWRAVFGRARHGAYSLDDVYAGFVEAGAEAGLVEAIRARVEGRPGAAGWEALLLRAGLAPTVQAGPPEEMNGVRRDACGGPDRCPEARWVVLEGLR